MTRYLLDTHSFIWLAAGDDRLSDTCSDIYLDTANDFYLSMASLWEMAIKASLGKLSLGRPLSVLIETAKKTQGARILPIELEHVCEVEGLPFHHRDPFDRLLVAQAKIEGLPLMSCDAVFDLYGIQRVW